MHGGLGCGRFRMGTMIQGYCKPSFYFGGEGGIRSFDWFDLSASYTFHDARNAKIAINSRTACPILPDEVHDRELLRHSWRPLRWKPIGVRIVPNRPHIVNAHATFERRRNWNSSRAGLRPEQ